MNSVVIDNTVVDNEEALHLAKQINKAHHDCEGAARDAVKYALHAGELLLKAKKLVKHGKWGDWLKKHCLVSPRQAQKYMRLWKRRGQLDAGNPNWRAHLTLSQANDFLAERDVLPEDAAEIEGVPLEDDDGNGNSNGNAANPDELGDDNQGDEEEDADGKDGNGEPDDEAADGEHAAAVKQHQVRCTRLKRFTAGDPVTAKDKPVKAAIDKGIDRLVEDVLKVIHKHARKCHTKAVRNMGTDQEFVAMALAAELKNRLDVDRLFAPAAPGAEQDQLPHATKEETES